MWEYLQAYELGWKKILTILEFQDQLVVTPRKITCTVTPLPYVQLYCSTLYSINILVLHDTYLLYIQNTDLPTICRYRHRPCMNLLKVLKLWKYEGSRCFYITELHFCRDFKTIKTLGTPSLLRLLFLLKFDNISTRFTV